MSDFINNILNLSFFEVWADIHGAFAMFSLILFGGAITLSFLLNKFAAAYKWLQKSVYWLLGFITVLDVLGLFVYRPYRAPVADSPRSILKSSEVTSWLHTMVFEHKEFLAFAPLLVVLVVAIIVRSEGTHLKNNPLMKHLVQFALIAALVLVLVVAAEAVLVTKAAPLK